MQLKETEAEPGKGEVAFSSKQTDSHSDKNQMHTTYCVEMSKCQGEAEARMELSKPGPPTPSRSQMDFNNHGRQRESYPPVHSL